MTTTNGRQAFALRIRYDAEAEAMYVRVSDGAVADTVEIAEMVYVDVDAEGRPLGIEFVVASDFLAFLTRNGGEFVLPATLSAALDIPVGA
jgi:uncharacterized protein YuzE